MKAIYHNLKEIPKMAFEGYIWKSDESEPEVLLNEIYDFDTVLTNPFIIEALLFCKEKNTAIHIQHTGSYQIAEYDLKALEKAGAVLEEKEYLPHRLSPAVKNVSFKQIWQEEEDRLCEGMPVLKMKAVVFCGFNKAK
ncbi:TIGR04423 family type III CRISPR-associated protein [Polaribacter sp. R2A056_3_33]|uniref:TIGR04423 family type III CRISPR-associated protein n=1 Tax=Polaribacter sp. R2A056_3_33 TaxID=2745563 RepID=UPI001C4ECB66|nr:TIGR04423 family type III CRISPR-associated protein [Polaribacter sp. R2A056_3_33]QXP70768.1 TIGR04423 family type III CRISPR-associated protein [Polaribacter sp. R2A056_3_33]